VFFSSVQRFAETRLSDLICSNEAVALEFEVYGKNAITREPLPFSFSQKTGSLTFRRRQSTASRPTLSSKWPIKPPTSRSTDGQSRPTSPP